MGQFPSYPPTFAKRDATDNADHNLTLLSLALLLTQVCMYVTLMSAMLCSLHKQGPCRVVVTLLQSVLQNLPKIHVYVHVRARNHR